MCLPIRSLRRLCGGSKGHKLNPSPALPLAAPKGGGRAWALRYAQPRGGSGGVPLIFAALQKTQNGFASTRYTMAMNSTNGSSLNQRSVPDDGSALPLSVPFNQRPVKVK